MIKKLNFIAVMYFTSLMLNAQDIDLSKFVVPEYSRNELQFNFNSSNNGEWSEEAESDIQDDQKNNSISLINNSRINFNRYANSSSYQGSQSISVGLDFPQMRKSNAETAISSSSIKSRTSSGSISYNSTNRFYSDSKWYWEADPNVNLRLYGNYYLNEFNFNYPDVNNSVEERKSANYSGNVNADFRVGKGRVEPVEDLRQVVYILTELKKAGRISREISEDETILIAQKLSALKNRRFLDSRLRLIEEMTEIEKIMTEMDIISDNDAIFFATVNDYWSMTANPVRSSGSRISLGVLPGYFFQDYHANGTVKYFNPDSIFPFESKEILNVVSTYISARYERFEPINLYWQQDFVAELFTDFESRTSEYMSDPEKSRMLYYGASANYSLKFYPNSRTEYSGDASLLLKRGEGAEDSVVEYRYASGNLKLSGKYYFSPHLTMQGSAGFNYYNRFDLTLNNTSIFPTKKDTKLFLNVSLLYKIF